MTCLPPDVAAVLADPVLAWRPADFVSWALRTRAAGAQQVLQAGMAAGEAANRPAWRAAYGRWLALDVPHADITTAIELLRGAGELPESEAGLLAQLLARRAAPGDHEAVRELLADTNLPGDIAWQVRCDLANPATAGGLAQTPPESALDWWELFTTPWREAELASPSLTDGSGAAFGRLRAPTGLPAVDDADQASVVMSAYNPDTDILMAARSVLQQSWRNLELLVIDDASTADAQPLWEALEALDERVRVIHAPENAGTYVARNLALKHATGRYVTFNDSDDFSHPQRIERQIAALRDAGALASRSGAVRAFADLTLTYPGYAARRLNASSLLFDVAALDLIGGFDQVRKSADMEWPHRLSYAKAKSVVDLSEPLAITQLRGGSLSRTDAVPGWTHWTRIAYRDGYTWWHERVRAGLDTPSSLSTDYRPTHRRRPFALPTPDFAAHAPAESTDRFDVVVLVDARRLLGGCEQVYSEVAALAQRGAAVGLASLEAIRPFAAGRDHGDPAVAQLCAGGNVQLTHSDMPIAARTLVVSAPELLLLRGGQRWPWQVEQVFIRVAAEQIGPRAIGQQVDQIAEQLFGVSPTWVPRDAQAAAWVARLGGRCTAVYPTAWPTPVPRTKTGEPDSLVVGHHLPDLPALWSSQLDVVNQVLPSNAQVRLAAPVTAATARVGELSRRWSSDRGRVDDATYLAGLDVWAVAPDLNCLDTTVPARTNSATRADAASGGTRPIGVTGTTVREVLRLGLWRAASAGAVPLLPEVARSVLATDDQALLSRADLAELADPARLTSERERIAQVVSAASAPTLELYLAELPGASHQSTQATGRSLAYLDAPYCLVAPDPASAASKPSPGPQAETSPPKHDPRSSTVRTRQPMGARGANRLARSQVRRIRAAALPSLQRANRVSRAGAAQAAVTGRRVVRGAAVRVAKATPGLSRLPGLGRVGATARTAQASAVVMSDPRAALRLVGPLLDGNLSRWRAWSIAVRAHRLLGDPVTGLRLAERAAAQGITGVPLAIAWIRAADEAGDTESGTRGLDALLDLVPQTQAELDSATEEVRRRRLVATSRLLTAVVDDPHARTLDYSRLQDAVAESEVVRAQERAEQAGRQGLTEMEIEQIVVAKAAHPYRVLVSLHCQARRWSQAADAARTAQAAGVAATLNLPVVGNAALRSLVEGDNDTGIALGEAAQAGGLAGNEKLSAALDEARDQAATLRDGWEMPHLPRVSHTTRPRAALSVLGQSLPLRSGGYATRSHGILLSLAAHGWDMAGVTRLGFPYDMLTEQQLLDFGPLANPDIVPGQYPIPYYRLLTDNQQSFPRFPLGRYVTACADGITKVAQEHGASLIHASSLFDVGMSGALAAERLQVPFVYEMRGLKQLLEGARISEFVGSPKAAYLDRIEVEVARRADRVLVITAALGQVMADLGVDPDRMVVIPNGVHAQRFTPRDRDAALAAELGLHDKQVIGYAGGFVAYEGLELLVQAVARLRDAGRRDIHLLLVGDGPHERVVRQTAEEYGVGGDLLTMPGRVPHDQVERFLSLVDIAAYPRRPLPVCELISPIKPFESMAMGKAVVVSNAAALTEIIEDQQTGRTFAKGDVDDLARVLGELLDDPAQRERLGAAAREWVLRERDWDSIGELVSNTYHELLG